MANRKKIVIVGKQRLSGFRKGLKYAYVDGRAKRKGNKYYLDVVKR